MYVQCLNFKRYTISRYLFWSSSSFYVLMCIFVNMQEHGEMISNPIHVSVVSHGYFLGVWQEHLKSNLSENF